MFGAAPVPQPLPTAWPASTLDQVSWRIGINACAPGSAPAENFPAGMKPAIVLRSEANLGKPGMMRRLFREPPIETEWTIWFDDDSFPFRADWLQSLDVAIAADPHAVMFGIPAVTHVCSEMADFIRAAPWYRGIPFVPSGNENAEAKLEFILGGFWVIRTEWLYRLDWPDPRIVHFEDDFLLGEAIRQNGGKLGRFHSGVKVDTAPRRAPSGMPTTLDVWQGRKPRETQA
jgi:hypothetical protein